MFGHNIDVPCRDEHAQPNAVLNTVFGKMGTEISMEFYKTCLLKSRSVVIPFY